MIIDINHLFLFQNKLFELAIVRVAIRYIKYIIVRACIIAYYHVIICIQCISSPFSYLCMCVKCASILKQTMMV